MLRLLLSIFAIWMSGLAIANTDSLQMVLLLEDFETNIQALEASHTANQKLLYADLQYSTQALSVAVTDKNKLRFLIQKLELQERINVAEEQYQLKLTRLRFKKGIELIKMIYEKILGLDHHFSSLQTYQNVASLTNPTSYPEFQKINELLEKITQKRQCRQYAWYFGVKPIYLCCFFSGFFFYC